MVLGQLTDLGVSFASVHGLTPVTVHNLMIMKVAVHRPLTGIG